MLFFSRLYWGVDMFDDFREWLSDNLRYVLLGLALVLVVIIGICIFRLIGGSSSKKSDTGKTTAVTASADDDQASTEASVNISAPEAGESLTRDDPELLELAKKYYTAVSAEDEATLATIVEPWNDSVKEEAFALNEKFKSFNNITTYSKDGPEDGTSLVYVYCECKVDGVDTGIPTLLNPLVVITTDSSDRKVSSDRSKYSDFINESNASDDVQALIVEVNRQYNELKNTNSQVGGTGTSAASSTGTTAEDSTEGAATTNSTSGGSYGTATATDGVNVRSEPSTNGAVLGTLYPGQEVNIVSTEGDWTHINYSDSSTGTTIDGYVSNSYLNIG